MLSLVLWVVPFVLLVWANYRLGGRDVLYPGFLMAGAWMVTFCVYLMAPIEVNVVRYDSMLYIFSVVMLFCGCCWASAHSGIRERETEPPRAQSRRWIYFLSIYSVVMLPLFWLDIQRIAGMSGFNPAILVASRLAINEAVVAGRSAYSNKFISSAPTVALFTALLCLIKMPRHWLTRVVCVNAFAMAVLTGGRPYILGLGVGAAYILLSRRSDRSFWRVSKKYALIFTALIIVLIFSTFLTKQEVQGNEDGTTIALRYAYIYIAGPVPVLDNILHSNLSQESLRDSLKSDRQDLLSVEVPFWFNVFSAPGDYFLRYGLVASLLVFGMLGALHGWLYANFIAGREWGLFLSAVMMYPLVISTFSDQYVGTWTRYAGAILFWMLYAALSRKRQTVPALHSAEQPAT
jgi:oligosaccharide repeat unit polymerase